MMRHASRFRKPPPFPFSAGFSVCLVVFLVFFSCSRADAPRSSTKAVQPSVPAVSGSPGKSVPIETPRTVMQTLTKDSSPSLPAAALRADLAIPGGGEAPRLPRDFAIGLLGVGSGRASSYALAVEILSSIAAGKPVADRFVRDGERQASAVNAKMAALGTSPSVRVGSPVDEPEGGVSYLVRFLGKGASLSGEIHLVPGKEGKWSVDALILDVDSLNAGKKGDGTPADFDPLIYKRFL